jgi:hypothetical protein
MACKDACAGLERMRSRIKSDTMGLCGCGITAGAGLCVLCGVLFGKDVLEEFTFDAREALAEELIAGALIAGALIAGALIAGALIAGALIAGALIAGALIAGARALELVGFCALEDALHDKPELEALGMLSLDELEVWAWLVV